MEVKNLRIVMLCLKLVDDDDDDDDDDKMMWVV
jgi:hypothetical protein